jgi:CheY-like chemotaxis protein
LNPSPVRHFDGCFRRPGTNLHFAGRTKGVSGFQICRRLRRMHQTRRSYIIALTAMSYPGIENICKDEGFDQTMLTPTSHDMVDRLSVYLRPENNASHSL